MEKQKYFIWYGIPNMGEMTDVIEAVSEQAAVDEAYYKALDVYDSYAGLHGITDHDEIAEEYGITDEDEIEEIYHEHRENVIDYFAEVYNPEVHDDQL